MSDEHPDHVPDGSDHEGRALPVTIRIGPDGRVYFHDITAELLPVALALDPRSAALKLRESSRLGLARKESP